MPSGDKLPRATRNEWLRRIRGETSQKRLARESGESRNIINEVEAGSRGYSLKSAEAIADALDEDALEIFIQSQTAAIKNKKSPEKSIEALARLRSKLRELQDDGEYDSESLEDAIDKLADEIADVLESEGVGADGSADEDDSDDDEDDEPRRKKARKGRDRSGWHPDDKDPRNPHYNADNRDAFGSKLDTDEDADDDEDDVDDVDDDDDTGRDALGNRRRKDL